MLLRIGRRKTSWENLDAREFCDTEFKGCADLRPSVYEVSVQKVIRVHTEHQA
jgi:hypothetical protein